MNYFIAIDIGGTQMRAACYPEGSLNPIKLEKRPTHTRNSTPEQVLFEVVQAVLTTKDKPKAIGVASPGPVDLQNGAIITAPNIGEWHNYPLVSILQEKFGVPVALDNDANLAALGEWKFGAGRGYAHLVYVTISTGIGGGIIIENRLLRGWRGLAAELGHITVMPDGPLCGCGQRGHIEAIASGTAIARQVSEELARGTPSSLPKDRPINTKDIAQAAAQGDELSIAALARAGYYLGQTLADFLHIFNPQALILGGGVTQSGALLLEPLRRALQAHVISPEYLKDLVITTAALGDEPGLLGALALAQQLSESK